MGHSHHHDAGTPSRAALAARRKANRLLTAILVPLGLLAVAGMIALWPSGQPGEITIADPYATAQGVSIDTGSVQRVGIEDCPSSATLTQAGVQAPQCQVAHVLPSSGGSAVAVEVPPEVAKTNAIEAGDSVRYLNLEDVMVDSGAPPYIFMDFVRSVPIAALAVLYAGVVIAVARWRGLRALIGLGGAYAVLAGFILPGLVEGKPPLLLGLVGSSVIMIGVLYFAHGFSARTSTALLGTLFGLGITAGLAAWATDAAHLIGVDNENAYTLINASDELSISGIILCGLIISGLGVLNDVTITQSSAVWEMYELAPGASARRLFAGAMRVGRDHIASTVYTIAFAYAGAALPVLILVSLYDRTLMETLTSGELAEEVVRTLVGSIGLVLAIPVTTGVAVLVVKAVGLSGARAGSADSRSPDTDSAGSGSPVSGVRGAGAGPAVAGQAGVPAAAAGSPGVGGAGSGGTGSGGTGTSAPATRRAARGRRAASGVTSEGPAPE